MSNKSNVISIKTYKTDNIYTVEFVDWKSYSVTIKADSKDLASEAALSLYEQGKLHHFEPRQQLFEVSRVYVGTEDE